MKHPPKKEYTKNASSIAGMAPKLHNFEEGILNDQNNANGSDDNAESLTDVEEGKVHMLFLLTIL